ncbi:MAG: helix-turn-helix domain-containing protein [Calditrichia bacterium]
MTDKTKTFYEQEVERITENHYFQRHLYIQVRQSKAFMEKYHSENINLQEIAAAASMSRFHFIRIFQQVYGLTPRQFLRDLRITKAKELLKKGLSVTQTCFEVGYESVSTFSSAFKRGTGYSPKKYQMMNNSNPEEDY